MKIATALLTLLMSFFLGGWFLMVGVQVAHNHWWPAVPTIGYWWACLIAFLISGALEGVPVHDD